MRYDIGPCRPDELPQLRELVNPIFRGGRGGDMFPEYPLLFVEENAEQLRVARDGVRLVAHVGLCIRDATIFGCRVGTVSVGSVGTHADYRGQGIASDLMADARAHSLARGASLMLISGGRGLYHRLGYVEVGRFREYTAARAAGTGPVQLEPAGYDHLDTAIMLHQREAVRFHRPREDWERLLAAGMLMNHAGDLFLVWKAGCGAAYVAVRRPFEARDGRRPPWVGEFAGCRETVAAALPALAAHYEADEALLVALADDLLWSAAAEAAGYSSRSVSFSGTLGILDAGRFLAEIRPYLEERLGSALDGLALEIEGEQVTFRHGEEAVTLATMGAFTALVFGGETDEARAVPPLSDGIAERLGRVFPMPLPWYGLNYV